MAVRQLYRCGAPPEWVPMLRGEGPRLGRCRSDFSTGTALRTHPTSLSAPRYNWVGMLELVFEEAAQPTAPGPRGLTLGRRAITTCLARLFGVRHMRGGRGRGTFRILDLDSTNGVKINDNFVSNGVLAAGDQVTIGSFQLLIEAPKPRAGPLLGDLLRPCRVQPGLRTGGASGAVSKEVGLRERVFETLAQVAKTLLQVDELSPVLEKVMTSSSSS